MAKGAKSASGGPSTPRAQRRRAQAPSARAIEAALAGIAHDIRTPLTGIVALAELLASSDLGAREREWANAIKSGADHLAALTTLIVDAAKAEADGLVLRNEPFRRARWPRLSARRWRRAPATRTSRPSIEIAHDLPAMVSGDALRLRAALENLADNAVKFTHQGTVTFARTAEAGRARPRAAGLHLYRQRHRHERGRYQAACSVRSRRPAWRSPNVMAAQVLAFAVVKRIATGDGRRPQGDQQKWQRLDFPLKCAR